MFFNDFDIFYQAALALLAGHSPYLVPGFYSPVWVLLPFMPLTMLPAESARIAWMILTLFGIIVALHRFGLKPLQILAVVLFTLLVTFNMMVANVDWLVLLGASLAPKWGACARRNEPQVVDSAQGKPIGIVDRQTAPRALL
jgi:hypothetical protein